ncbi:MAG: VOC family protein [Planctomycetes bacterium]|nr:VOC family protein [Planctomycetota bacterium]
MSGPSFTHVALHVPDMDAAVAFFADYCKLQPVHTRGEGPNRVVWLAEPGREKVLVFVLIPGGDYQPQGEDDFGHLGFALASKQAVDDVAAKARAEGRLAWEPRQHSFPVGYYCAVQGPDGRAVEFSYGQPLGPDSPDLT